MCDAITMCSMRSLIVLLCCGIIRLHLLLVKTKVVQISMTTHTSHSLKDNQGNYAHGSMVTDANNSWTDDRVKNPHISMKTHTNRERKENQENCAHDSMVMNGHYSRKDNRTLYMISETGGKLGNNLFQYAVLFGLTFNSVQRSKL